MKKKITTTKDSHKPLSTNSGNGSFQNIPQLTPFGDRLTQGACPRLWTMKGLDITHMFIRMLIFPVDLFV